MPAGEICARWCLKQAEPGIRKIEDGLCRQSFYRTEGRGAGSCPCEIYAALPYSPSATIMITLALSFASLVISMSPVALAAA